MPVFMPYVEKEAGGMRFEDFTRDYYEGYGKKEGITYMGTGEDRAFLVFDEGFLQVQRKEGKYPSGILEGSWPAKQYNEKHVGGVQNPFTQNGEEWRQGRMSVNPHIFNKQAALSYLDTINESASNAAAHFEDYAANGKLDRFCELAAFDMFVAASLGLQMNSVGGDERGLEFAREIVGSLVAMSDLSIQCPYSKMDAFKFKAWDDFVDTWGQGREAAKELLRLAMEEKQGTGKGIMHGFLGGENLKISNEEATEMFLMLTFAAADTTSSLINNVLTNLSHHPEIQGKVREEFKKELGGKEYHADAKFPYFQQVLKESQRLTPPLPWASIKTNIPTDLVIHGYNIPKGSTVAFSNMRIASDEAFAGKEPSRFNPDRYSEEAIAARKGTKAEFLDHPIACKPFGFGARMCVGSRIARLEYNSLISRILQDYELEYDQANSKPSIRLTKVTTVEYPSPIFRVKKL